MNTKDQNLDFLRDQIGTINTALFKAEINDVLNIPNCIIRTHSTDEAGNIYFFMNATAHLQLLDRPFYAYLEYNQKGTGNMIRISGSAMLHQSSQGLHTHQSSAHAGNEVVLTQLKMMQVEYTERHHPVSATNFKIRMNEFLADIFGYRQHKRLAS